MNCHSCDASSFGLRAGSPEHAAENDKAFQRALDALAPTGGRLLVPSGDYWISRPIRLEKRRNLVLVGSGGNYVQPGTRLRGLATDGPACLVLRTAIHCRFESLCLIAENPAASAVVGMEAVEDGPSAVSSLNNSFVDCSFRSAAGSESTIGLTLRDTGHAELRRCWFQAPIAALIGQAIRQPAPTISNGQCSNVAFNQCLFFGDVLGQRGTNITFDHCEFAVRPNGDGTHIDFDYGPRPAVRNVAIRDCLALNGVSHRGSFFTQGRGGSGLVMTNNRIRGYATAARINGEGAALLAANVFEQVGPGATDIDLSAPAESISLLANSHAATLAAGNPAVRTSPLGEG